MFALFSWVAPKVFGGQQSYKVAVAGNLGHCAPLLRELGFATPARGTKREKKTKNDRVRIKAGASSPH